MNPNKVIRKIICFNCLPKEPEMEYKEDDGCAVRYECPYCNNIIIVILKEA